MLREENRPLAPLTTLGIGGPARWFAEAYNESDIVEAADWAHGQGIALFVLGGGSNLVVADAGFDGLVLRIRLQGMQTSQDAGLVLLQAAAGESWDRCVDRSLSERCVGLECLAGIPGTVGGTPVQNVGAYGQEVSTTIVRVRAFDLMTREFVEFTNPQCAFAYRRSRFNTVDRGRYVVTRVDYRLAPNGAPNLHYADLQRAFPPGSHPTAAAVAEAVRRIRQSKGMLLVDGDPDCRSAGSFFKNPIVASERAAEIAAQAGNAPPCFPAGQGSDANHVKLSAAWLIEQAGFSKGYARGPVGLSSRHTLALINRGGATATQILAFADEIADAVEARFAIRLAMEPELLGFVKNAR
jgi:UDP-N-acetylmuramate dehydrogenase